MFNNLAFTWPDIFAQVNSDCSTALGSASGELDSAGARLAAAPALSIVGNPVAGDAAGSVERLQALLVQVLASVNLVCIHPWCQGVGQGENHYRYLSPFNAVSAAANKLTDIPDSRKPAGTLDALALVVSAKSFDDFAKTLKQLNSIFPVAELQLCARRAKALATLEQDKQVLPDAAINARWNTQGISALGKTKLAGAALGELCAHAAAYEDADITPDDELNALISKKVSSLNDAQNAVASLAATFSGGVGRGAFFTNNSPAQLKNSLANSDLSHDDPIAVCLLLAGAPGSLDAVQEMLGL